MDIWLTDCELFDIADSLLFEIRLDERLEFIYNTHVKSKESKIFDAFTARFEQIKRELDKPLREEVREWQYYKMQEEREGRKLDLEGMPNLADLRREQGYPTSTLFPAYWQQMPHISWQYVENVRTHVELFILRKEINNLKSEISDLDLVDNSASDTELTKRQRILKYFYEGGKMVERKHKDYTDYNLMCSPRKRLAYPNESLHKLKPLIEDIVKIRPLLSEKAKKEADSELNTLKSQLTVEK